MRSRILVLFLCVGTTAFCQPAAGSPDQLGRVETAFTHPVWEINQLPSGWNMNNTAPVRVLIQPRAGAAQHWNDARIDPRIIVHPPPSSVGTLPPGTLVAKNLYPDLRFQPVQWPNLKFQRIPTQWPRFEIVPTVSGTPATARAAVK